MLMIRIFKTAVSPAILQADGVTQTNALIKAYTDNPIDYTSAPGVRSNKTLEPMNFDNKIYGHYTVKNLLIADQHEKCCFCESKFLDNSYGDVEHFRPKKAYKKLNSKTLTYPGYYWLAYDWTNLMLSCEKCNRSYKGNLFPLTNEATRKPYHNHPNSLLDEDCLLINPNYEDPGIFITFKEEVPIPVAGSLKGKKTIDAFQLERMNNSRFEHLLMLELALIFTEIDPTNDNQVNLAVETFKVSRDIVMDKIAKANMLYNSVAKDTAKFSQCVRNKFPQLPTI